MMKKIIDVYVLDTSAWLALIENEEGVELRVCRTKLNPNPSRMPFCWRSDDYCNNNAGELFSDGEAVEFNSS